MKLGLKCFVGALLAAVVMQGCVVTRERNVSADPSAMSPKRKPIYNKTNMDDALSCIDRLLAENQNIGKVRIYVDSQFPDLASAGVNGTRDMLITSLMKMSARSRKVAAIIYNRGSDLGVLSDLSPGGAAFKFPQYFLRGSITQAEKRHSTGGNTKSVSIGVPKVADAGAKEAETVAISSVALDLHLGELNTLELIPGMYSSNVLSIVERDTAGDVYAGVMDKVDFEYEVQFTDREGMSAAVRALTEMGVLEIVGRLFNLDYRSCIDPRSALGKPAPQDGQVAPASPPGEFGLELSSDRGGAPVYSKGETIRVSAIPKEEMFLYCFYEDRTKGGITQLYPNSFAPQAHRAKGEELHLPSPAMPFQIEMDSAGSDVFACFGSSTEITTADLEKRIGVGALELNTKVTLQDIEKSVSDLSAGIVGKGKMTITVK